MLRNVHIFKVNGKVNHRRSSVAHNFDFICSFSSKNPHARQHFSARKLIQKLKLSIFVLTRKMLFGRQTTHRCFLFKMAPVPMLQRSHDSNDNSWPLNEGALFWDLVFCTATTKRLMCVDELPQNIYFTSNLKEDYAHNIIKKVSADLN